MTIIKARKNRPDRRATLVRGTADRRTDDRRSLTVERRTDDSDRRNYTPLGLPGRKNQ